LKYVQKILKKETVSPCYPLNYLLHQNLMGLYFDAEGALDPTYKDLHLDLQAFADKTLGVKPPYQILHLMRQIFVHSLKGQSDFSQYSEQQNRDMYSLKSLIVRLNKEFSGVLC